MTTTTRLLTAEELLRMPDDGYRYELVRGELKKMAPAGHRHGRIAANITGSLIQYVIRNNLGAVYAAETGFKLATDPDHVRAPDVAFVRQERVEEVKDTEGYWPGAPDLAIEVISPGDSYTEVQEKVFDWLDAGARAVMAVDPRKRIVTVYRSLTDIIILTEKDRLKGGDVVPGWEMLIKDVFA
jgi:Uma2 family endonuclease